MRGRGGVLALIKSTRDFPRSCTNITGASGHGEGAGREHDLNYCLPN